MFLTFYNQLNRLIDISLSLSLLSTLSNAMHIYSILTDIGRFSALFDFDWLRQYLILFASIQK